MADLNNKIQKYIQEIASTSVASNKKAAKFAANISTESRAKEAQFQAMTAQIQALTNIVAIAAKENRGGGRGGNGGGGSGRGGRGGNGGGEGGKRTFKFTRNMGAYCHTHGHHPIGVNHTSATCTNKRDGHNNLPTADHHFGGSNFWPGLSKVKSSQHDHISYKGKSANN
jgi:hypothetical protein